MLSKILRQHLATPKYSLLPFTMSLASASTNMLQETSAWDGVEDNYGSTASDEQDEVSNVSDSDDLTQLSPIFVFKPDATVKELRKVQALVLFFSERPGCTAHINTSYIDSGLRRLLDGFYFLFPFHTASLDN